MPQPHRGPHAHLQHAVSDSFGPGLCPKPSRVAALHGTPSSHAPHFAAPPSPCNRRAQAATVSCYGSYIGELQKADSAAWGDLGLGGPVLGIYGAEDTMPGPDAARQFAVALAAKEIAHNVTIYDGVGHAFINPEAYRDAAAKGHGQAVAAWQEIETFLASAFAANGASGGRRSRRASAAAAGSDAAVASASPGGALRAEGAPRVRRVPFLVALRNRVACAYKCAMDVFTQAGWDTGHWHAA